MGLFPRLLLAHRRDALFHPRPSETCLEFVAEIRQFRDTTGRIPLCCGV